MEPEAPGTKELLHFLRICAIQGLLKQMIENKEENDFLQFCNFCKAIYGNSQGCD